VVDPVLAGEVSDPVISKEVLNPVLSGRSVTGNLDLVFVSVEVGE
jgi:hypothetical protein